MASYAIDLRQNILHAYERRIGSQRALADMFGVSLAFVEQLCRRHRPTGAIAPKPHAGGQRPRVDGAAQAPVRQLVRDQPDATWEELCPRAAAMTGSRVSGPTMGRLVPR